MTQKLITLLGFITILSIISINAFAKAQDHEHEHEQTIASPKIVID